MGKTGSDPFDESALDKAFVYKTGLSHTRSYGRLRSVPY